MLIVYYSDDDDVGEVIITEEANEEKMLKEWFGEHSSRSVGDYYRARDTYNTLSINPSSKTGKPNTLMVYSAPDGYSIAKELESLRRKPMDNVQFEVNELLQNIEARNWSMVKSPTYWCDKCDREELQLSHCFYNKEGDVCCSVCDGAVRPITSIEIRIEGYIDPETY